MSSVEGEEGRENPSLLHRGGASIDLLLPGGGGGATAGQLGLVPRARGGEQPQGSDMHCPEIATTRRSAAARATAIASTKGGREGPAGGGLYDGGGAADDDDGAAQERRGLAGGGGGGGARKTRARRSSEMDGGAEEAPKRIRKEGGRRSIGKVGIAEGSNGRGTGAMNPTRAKKSPFKGKEPNNGGRVGGGSAGSDPPKYDGAALAVVVFADPFFYNNKESVANDYSGERDVFLKNKTIDQIRQEYMTKTDGCVELMRAIGVIDVPVQAYFAAALVSVEQVLAGERFIAIGEVDEVDHYLSIGAADLPTLDTLFNNYQPPQGGSPEQRVKSRSMQLCMVTGSSGSGKTFFCLHYLTRFLRNADDLSLAFYLHPLQLVSDAVGSDGSSIGKEVVRLVRSTIAEEFNRRVTSKLKMHVCLIFDEAGDLGLDGLFEEPTLLQGIYAHVKRNLATNVVMVVSGTGITGSKLKSGCDAYFYRLKPWNPEDLEKILDPRAGLLHLKKSENVRTVVDAIVAHPKLRALTTNARSAYFLVEALASLCSVYVQEFWRVQLDAWAPALVTKVVHGYIATNGIREITVEQRVLVAASVFQALDEAEFNTTDLPRFSILTKKEKSVAIALLTYNVERKGNDKMPSLVDGESFTISVTPAIAIVLFTMAGLQVSMVPGRRAEVEVAGLHAARRLILKPPPIH
jgi:hypothetical protein